MNRKGVPLGTPFLSCERSRTYLIGRRTVFGKSRIKAYVMAAVIAAAVPAFGISLPVSAEESRGPEYMMQAAADEVLRETEAVVQEVRRKAMDPEGASVFISSSGKAVAREDGKWVTPGEKPESDQEISIVFVGDIIFDTTQNPWSSIAYSDGIRACFDDETWESIMSFPTRTGERPLPERPSPSGALHGQRSGWRRWERT